MKILAAGILMAASVASASAQIVTLHGTVYGSIQPRFPGVYLGDEVTETYQIDHFKGTTSAFNGGAVYKYDATATLKVGNLGALFSDKSLEFDVQDVAGASGIIAITNAPGEFFDSVELWSTDSSVLKNHFIVAEADGSKFDWLHSGFFSGPIDPNNFVWKLDSIDVSSASPVPEASTFGYVAAVGLLGLTLYRRSKRA